MACVLAVTGGVACGKSFFLKCLKDTLKIGLNDLDALNIASFSCDESVGNLLTDDKIVGTFTKSFGSRILDNDGCLDRSTLRQIVFEDSEVRKEVEDILHPHVLQMAEAFLFEHSSYDFLLMEVPLLYEVGFPIKSNFEIVIGCSKHTQQNRLSEIRKLPREQGDQIIASQWSVAEKVKRGDFVIWNDGSVECFEDQIRELAFLLVANIGLWQKT